MAESAGSPPGTLFRKIALDRLSSPEQLDQLLHITRPAGWVALVTLLGLVILALGWGIFGSIPTQVRGSAILIKTGGVYEVVARSGGVITDVSVRAGDIVKRGQKIARIAQPALLDEFNLLQVRRAGLASKAETTTRLLQQRRSTLHFSNDVLNRRLEEQGKLLREGLVTQQSVLAIQQQLAENASLLRQLDVQKLEVEQELALLDRNIESVKTRLKLSADVTSPYSGRVLEIKQDENGVVQPGTAVLTMELMGDAIKDLEVVAFVNAGEGKKVRPGMVIHIAPSTVRPADYGYMVGKVTSVSEFPATPQGMMRILQNQQLVQQLSANSTQIQISADLVPDPKAASGYRWTSPGGPPQQVQSGTLGEASITVRKDRPLSLVIPKLREFAGL